MCGQVQEVLWNIVGGFRVIVGVIHVQTILLRFFFKISNFPVFNAKGSCPEHSKGEEVFRDFYHTWGWGINFTDNGGPTLFRLVFFTSIKS